MAQQIIRRFTCDRCKKPYEEADPESKANPEVIFSATSAIRDAEGKPAPANVRFEDLCPRCQGRVLDLLAQIRLDKADAGEKNPGPTEGQSALDLAPGSAASTDPASTTDSAAAATATATGKKKPQNAGSTEPPTSH